MRHVVLVFVILAALMSDAWSRHASMGNRLGLNSSSPLLPEIGPVDEDPALHGESPELALLHDRPYAHIPPLRTDCIVVSYNNSYRQRHATNQPDLRHACGQQAPPLA